MTKSKIEYSKIKWDQIDYNVVSKVIEVCKSINPNRSLEKASCHFLMTAIRKTALYMLDS